MVEIMHMCHKMATETQFVNGLVLDHGRRNSDMPAKLKNCYILTCNVNLEDEKTEVQGGFFFSNAKEREELFASERKFCD
jgi:T-complex protein 1 subunit zeta